MNSSEFHDTDSPRTGKIARLPLSIRQTLNERLANNEPGQGLVDWLNSLPETNAVLEQLFEGRPITQQNLSAWKLGGFRDWERLQQTRALAREFLEEAEELADEVYSAKRCEQEDGGSILDRVSDRMALALLQLFREAEIEEKGAPRTRTMLEVAREVARLRRGDHHRQHAAIAQQRWEDEQDQAEWEEIEKIEAKTEDLAAGIKATGLMLREEFIHGLATGELSPWREKKIRDHFAQKVAIYGKIGVPDLPVGEELAAQIEEIRQSLPKRDRRSKAAKADADGEK